MRPIHDLEASLARQLKIPERHVCVVGSTLICGKGNDIDYLCLVPNEKVVLDAGFILDAEVTYESELHSYRYNGENIIATTSEAFFYAELAIAHAARLLKEGAATLDMSSRDDRIEFHQAIRAQVLARLRAQIFVDDPSA